MSQLAHFAPHKKAEFQGVPAETGKRLQRPRELTYAITPRFPRPEPQGPMPHFAHFAHHKKRPTSRGVLAEAGTISSVRFGHAQISPGSEIANNDDQGREAALGAGPIRVRASTDAQRPNPYSLPD